MKLQTKLHWKIKGGQDCKKNKRKFQTLLKHIRKKPMQFVWHTFHEEIDGFYQYVNEDIMIQQCIVLHYFYIILLAKLRHSEGRCQRPKDW
jgi:hypothetical protein